MENGTELRAMTVALGNAGGQAEVVAPNQSEPENQVSAETVVEKPIEVTPPAPEAEAVITPAAEEIVTPPVSEPYNYWTELDQKTEGLVKDEASFATILERAKSYDTLVQEKEALEKATFKPANEWIATINDMAYKGANPDQIKAFVTLNGYGDLAALSPIDLKVTKMVLKDGFTENIARKIVEREYDLKQFDEELPAQKEEADIMRERLRISAKADLAELNEYKKELSVVNNPERENAEKARLQEIADLSTYNKTVEQQAPAIAKHFPTKLDYEFKIGEEVVAYEDSIDKDFLEKELVPHLHEYFKDSLDPINQETVAQAYEFAFGEYLKANDARRIEKAVQKGFTIGYEKAVNKYENRSGLPTAPENQVIPTNESGLSEFTKRMVGRQ
jgi:hypothetical protein